MTLPSVYERKWPTVILSPISISNHIVTVSSTCSLHSKQVVVLSKTGLESKEFEIKRILSDTQLHVGPKDSGRMQEYSNPVEFDGGTLSMHEQNRNPMSSEIVLRAVYAEEQIVALRTIGVDKWGQYWDIDNPLPVSISGINIGDINADIVNPSKYKVINLPLALANTEYNFSLPSTTKRMQMMLRDGKGPLRIYDSAGAASFYTVNRGAFFQTDDIDVTALTFYIQSGQASCTLEILYWEL